MAGDDGAGTNPEQLLGDMDKAEAMIEKAHKVCPYSNATRSNIEVILSVI